MSDNLSKILMVMLGGSLGAVLRYWVSLLTARIFGPAFAWGTLIVNCSGCLMIGVAFALAERTSLMGPLARIFFVTGFLGALTTFSTFAMESINFFKADANFLAIVNVLANNVLGLALVVIGLWLGRQF